MIVKSAGQGVCKTTFGKRGFDFILIAQQGLQLDPLLRGLYEEHVHVRQTSILRSKTKPI
ncbi:hypothetical protein D7Y53_22695 [Stenotrophomonas maltophilia]|nr:hypothetical protein [Stenotrophomonas maltophilia]MBA0323419.1 hypothetical protein [Stenotrophomonas maltophilia]MBA0432719.1 hypothetical protein [Stenotrophomonas maltophilia]